MINGAVLGLKGDDYLAVLRMRPSVPLMGLLRRRLMSPDGASLEARQRAGDQLLELLSEDVPVLGRRAPHHSWWQFCVVSPDPAALIAHLRMRGFDATDGSSRLAPALAPAGHADPRQIRETMKHVIYIPAYAQLGERGRRDLAHALSERSELLAWLVDVENEES